MRTAESRAEYWEEIATEYIDLYPKPPTRSSYVIMEESETVAHSMSH